MEDDDWLKHIDVVFTWSTASKCTCPTCLCLHLCYDAFSAHEKYKKNLTQDLNKAVRLPLSHLAALDLLLSLPQVLFVVVQPVIDGLGQIGCDLGPGLVVSCAVAAGVFAEVRRGLGDDEDLVDILVVKLVVRVVLVRPVGEFVLPGRHLLHLLVEHEVQLLLVRFGLGRRLAARSRRDLGFPLEGRRRFGETSG